MWPSLPPSVRRDYLSYERNLSAVEKSVCTSEERSLSGLEGKESISLREKGCIFLMSGFYLPRR